MKPVVPNNPATQMDMLPGKIFARALRNQSLSHAYLFLGPPGLGQDEMAQTVVAAIMCAGIRLGQGTDVLQPCRQCIPCQKVGAGNHPDVHWIQSSGTSIKLADLNQALQEVWYRPLEGPKRCFIIPNSHRLTVEAANRLLKILEEPPDYVMFILMASSVADLPGTITSRCYPVPFRPLPPGRLAGWLGSERQLEPATAQTLAAVTGGNPGLANEWLERSLFPKVADDVCQLLYDLSEQGISAALEWAERLSSVDETIVDAFLDILPFVLRDLWLLAKGVPSKQITFLDRLTVLSQLANSWGQFDYEGCIAAIALARSRISSHVQMRNVLDALFIALAGKSRQLG